MTIQVLRPGLLTTVQDAGRFGNESIGIGPGGAMDLMAPRLANLLIGNEPDAASLEITLLGPVLRFERDTLIALCGAHTDATINGARLPHGRAILARAGAELVTGATITGCRAMLAMGGGIEVPVILGSRSTNLRAAFGGLDGRALRAGDILPTGGLSSETSRLMATLPRSGAAWAADGAGFSREFAPTAAAVSTLRLIPGPEFADLVEASRTVLLSQPFRVSARSDRMGYRLEGPALLLADRREMTSEGVTWGTVQLPPDGHPIILLADRQTTGGYPVIGHIASADRSVVAQCKPGDQIQFMLTALEAAQEALRRQDRDMNAAAAALRAQRRGELT